MAPLYRLKFPIIKVCGVTRMPDVDQLAAAGANTIGLNFVRRSPRCLSMEAARPLLDRAAELQLSRVAVLMNPSTDDLTLLLNELQFDYVQLHGTEVPELLNQIQWPMLHRPIGIIKAISWSGRSEEAMLAAQWTLQPTSTLVPGLSAFLVDAYAPGEGGGTGRVARWDLLAPRPSVFGQVPVILAGGLVPNNVASAISEVGPDGVDTASGVEQSPGIKAVDLVKRFCSEACFGFGERRS